MIRILQVIGSLNNGGSQAMIMNIYRNIDRTQMQFDFVIFYDNERQFEEEIIALGGKVYYIKAFNGKNLFSFVKAWKNFLKEHPEYRIVHGHVRSVAAIYLYIANKMGRTTIVHSHSTSNGKGILALVKDVLQYPVRYIADYLFACSDEAGKWLFGEKALLKDTYYFFPNAINISLYRYDEYVRDRVRKEYGIQDKLVLGTVGRIMEAKNPYGLLDIFERTYQLNKNIVLMWIGSGELEEAIKKETKKRKLSDAIIFMGNRTDVPTLLQGLDIFLFPSLWEGLPVTVVEAQAAGLHCLVSNNVTRQVGISQLVKYLPITEGADKWVNEILNQPLERMDVTREIKQAGFDITESVLWLEEFYKNISKKAM